MRHYAFVNSRLVTTFMVSRLLLNNTISRHNIMDVSREAPQVTTKPTWHDLTNINTCTARRL